MPIKLKILATSLLLALSYSVSALERLDLVPTEAQTYLRISNTTNFWSQLKQSSIGKLWVDPQFQNFLGHPEPESFLEFFFDGEIDAEDDVFIEQLKMLSGEIILAFDLDMEDPYIIAAMTHEDFIRSLEMDEKLQQVSDKPFDIVKSTFQNVEIVQHIKNVDAPDKESIWQAHLNGTLVMGNTREWVEQSIIKLKKEPVKNPTGNPVATLNMPLSRLIKTIAEDDDGGMDIDLIFDALGLMGIETFSVKIELHESEMVVDSNLRVSDLSKGIFTILDTEPSELPSVTFIPENISSLEVGRFNLLRLWQEIPNMLSTAMPEVKPQFDMMVAMLQQQAGIDFEQEILANLGTQYLSFSEVEGTVQSSVVAIELKDGMAFKTGLETVMAAPALQPQVAAGLEIEEFLGHTIYTVKRADPENAIAFGVSGDYLFYSQPEGLRKTIRTQNNAAAGNRAFENSELLKGLRENVPPRAFGFGAVDWKKNMDTLVHEISDPEYISAMLQSWAKSGSAIPPPDFNKLPPTEHIASFFNVSYQYTEATGGGLHQRITLKY